MFPGQAIKTGLTLPKVIGGISKTLNVANQIIPLYMQAKPMIQNAKSAFSVAKEIMATSNTKSTNQSKPSKKQTSVKQIKQKEVTTLITSSNNPVFFL